METFFDFSSVPSRESMEEERAICGKEFIPTVHLVFGSMSSYALRVTKMSIVGDYGYRLLHIMHLASIC